MKIKIIAALALLTFSSCTTIHKIGQSEDDCIFSLQMTHSSATGAVDIMHGVYVYQYFDNAPTSEGQPYVVISVFRDGKELSSFGTNNSYRILSAINEAKLPDIDYSELMKSTEEKVAKDGGVTIAIMDGAEYELKVDYKDSKCSFRMWNPIQKLDYLADHDAVLGRLNSVFEMIALEVGKEQIDI